MAKLIVLSLSALKSWLSKHKRLAVEAVLSLLLALSVGYGTMLHNKNKTLSEGLEMANNNIEAYQDIVNGTQQANGVLVMQIEELKNSNDKLLQKVDSVAKENKISTKSITSAATQTQSILVNKSKGVRGDLVEILKDSIYNDSINYNQLTTVYYTIGKDTVNIKLDVKNTQYLYTYKTREYKNKKNFLKRLFTLDFKKVDKYKYKIVNTNDLLEESDIRIIENK